MSYSKLPPAYDANKFYTHLNNVRDAKLEEFKKTYTGDDSRLTNKFMETFWWKDYVVIDWNVKSHDNAAGNCTYISIRYRENTLNPFTAFRIRYMDEVTSGNIDPVDPAEAAAINSNPKPNQRLVKPREGGAITRPQVGFQKWRKPPSVNEATGEVVSYPDMSHCSYLFLAVEMLTDIYTFESNTYIGNGTRFKNFCDDTDKWTKEDFLVKYPNGMPFMIFADSVLGSSDVLIAGLAKIGAVLRNNYISVPTATVTKPIQYKIKSTGRMMSNPIVRFKKPVGSDPKTNNILDKSTGKEIEGKKNLSFDYAKVDGVLINPYNIHKFIKSRSCIDGFVRIDSLCITNLSISMSPNMFLTNVSPPVYKEEDVDDLYGEEEEEPSKGKDPSPDIGTSADGFESEFQ